MTHVRRSTAAIAGLVFAALTACGPTHREAQSSPSPRGADLLAIGHRFSACMRSHGSPHYPDLIPRNGQLMLPPGHDSKKDIGPTRAGAQTCDPILAKLPKGAMYKGPQRPPGPADMPKLLAFSRCMRSKGVAGWPDPKSDGTFPVSGTPLAGRTGTVRVRNAAHACARYWHGAIQLS